MRATTAVKMATDRQVELIVELANEDRLSKIYIDTQLTANKVSHPRDLKFNDARCIINVTLDEKRARRGERKAHTPPPAEPKAGMYRKADGTILRVYLGQQSGKMLAKEVVDDGVDEFGKPTYALKYLGQAIRFIGDAVPLPLEEAKAWGRMTSTCVVCARRLDVPESVDAGIGPKCARSFG